MSTGARKKRELMQRDELLLDAAHELLGELGFSNLTLEKLAARTDFSKGTIYNHFTSKEDLLTALCVRALQIELEMFTRAVDFPGNSREKMIGLFYTYNLYARRYPTLFMCLLSGLTPSVIEKSSAKRMQERRLYEAQITKILDQVVVAGVASGDVKLAPGMSVPDITFASWSMGFGTTALLQSASRATSIERLNMTAVFELNVSLILDGLQWRPLSRDEDYAPTWQRLRKFFGEKEPKKLPKARAANAVVQANAP